MESMESRTSATKKASTQVLALPLTFALLLAAFTALPAVRESPRQLWSFLIASGALAAWSLGLWATALQKGRALSAKIVIRRPHWLQPLVQGAIYIYWGMHWPQVGKSAPLIAAQIVFAYAFDMLLAWSTGDEYELGFGPFPIILSMNLFMWFKPDWFYWQFVMVAIGFGAKRLVRWKKDGYLAHIFNPSSFPLAIISLGLLLSGTTDHTWGHEIANALSEPGHIYEFLFLVALPGQLLFGVASMSMPAVFTAFVLGEIYFRFTGSYYFFAQIPAAAFLGMLLLFTDPSTAPKSETGRVIYGFLYGLSVFVVYGLLDLLQLPLFYDKLLFVPFLNLGVQAIDRFASGPRATRFDVAKIAPTVTGLARNLAWAGIWTVAFALMFATHAVGDSHPGNRLPFWLKACAENKRNACRNAATVESDLCERGAGWACNEYGVALSPPPPGARAIIETNLEEAKAKFARACSLGTRSGCANAEQLQSGIAMGFHHEPPAPEEYDHLIDNRGLPEQRTTLQAWEWACDQGWTDACMRIQALTQSGPNSQRTLMENGCRQGDANACRSLGMMYRTGTGGPRDEQRAIACLLGLVNGCVDPK